MLELSDVFFDFSMKLWDTPNIVIICLSFGSLVDNLPEVSGLFYFFRSIALTYSDLNFLSSYHSILLIYM